MQAPSPVPSSTMVARPIEISAGGESNPRAAPVTAAASVIAWRPHSAILSWRVGGSPTRFASAVVTLTSTVIPKLSDGEPVQVP